MKDNITKITILTVMLLTILGVIGFSYAYFSTDFNGEGKYITLDAAELKLKYTDDVTMSLTNAIPGDKIERVFTVENIGTKTVSYNIVWKDLVNTIDNYDLHLDMKCKSYKNYGKSNQEEYGTCDSFYKAVPTTETSISKDIRKDIEIEVGVTQVYNVTITFVNRNYSQENNLNKSFSGKIALEEYIDPSPEPVYCTYDGELVQGAEYINGQYTYRYMQQRSSLINVLWSEIAFDGWGVSLTNIDSTGAVTSKVCTYINNKPVISAIHMFSNSKATSIDLSSFNTSNIINMGTMFYNSHATEIKGLNTFNTNNVTDMNQMFKASKVIILNLDNFNTKNVTDMSGMFYETQATKITGLDGFDTRNVTNMGTMFYTSMATEIDVSSFDTSNTTQFNSMFSNSQVKVLDVSNFDTSNAINMRYFFGRTKVANLDLSNFNTSKVNDMTGMFYYSNFSEIKLNNFDTSNVTDMNNMFTHSKATTIDVSSFDTSKVTNMSTMFFEVKADALNFNNFDTHNVEDMHEMFSNISAVYIDISHFDTSKVTNMNNMFYGSELLKTIYVGDKFNVNKVTTSDYMFAGCSNLVGGKGTKYNGSYIDKTYARIDGGTSSPGYFTAR